MNCRVLKVSRWRKIIILFFDLRVMLIRFGNLKWLFHIWQIPLADNGTVISRGLGRMCVRIFFSICRFSNKGCACSGIGNRQNKPPDLTSDPRIDDVPFTILFHQTTIAFIILLHTCVLHESAQNTKLWINTTED